MKLRFHLIALAAGLSLAAIPGGAQRAAAASAAPPVRPPVDTSQLPAMAPEDLRKIETALPPQVHPPARPRHLLVFWRCEGFFHAEGIAYANAFLTLAARRTGAFSVEFSREWEALDAHRLARCDALVFNNTTRLEPGPEHRRAILDFIHQGKGIVGIHAATDSFRKWPEGAQLLGAVFDGHPWGAGGTWAFKLDESRHPLVRAFGGNGFKLKDEIYQFKDPYTRADRRVLLSLDLSDPTTREWRQRPNTKTGVPRATRTDDDFAVAWIKHVGAGRLFYCSLGHNGSVYQDPSVVRFYLDGMQWALGDFAADATPIARNPKGRIQP